jgi:hypothetical protein
VAVLIPVTMEPLAEHARKGFTWLLVAMMAVVFFLAGSLFESDQWRYRHEAAPLEGTLDRDTSVQV